MCGYTYPYIYNAHIHTHTHMNALIYGIHKKKDYPSLEGWIQASQKR